MTTQNFSQFNHLVVTRPATQAQSLLRQLNELQTELVNFSNIPLIEVQAKDFEVSPTDQFAGMIFISSHAADYFYSSFDFNNEHNSSSATKLFAVGDNTANRVKQLTNQPVIFPQQMNAEGLLKLPQLQLIKDQNWLIVKGEGGREIIRDTLLSRNAKVTEVDVYQRNPPPLEDHNQIISAQSSHTVWLITSNEALNNLYTILGLADKKNHLTQVIISSNRLAERAMTKGFTIIGQSEGASVLQLVECVKTLLDSRH